MCNQTPILSGDTLFSGHIADSGGFMFIPADFIYQGLRPLHFPTVFLYQGEKPLLS